MRKFKLGKLKIDYYKFGEIICEVSDDKIYCILVDNTEIIKNNEQELIELWNDTLVSTNLKLIKVYDNGVEKNITPKKENKNE
jgi:hypothetical protein